MPPQFAVPFYRNFGPFSMQRRRVGRYCTMYMHIEQVVKEWLQDALRLDAKVHSAK